MIRGEPLTVIIPVRGGSKGIPGKNLMRPGGGDTLLERSIKLAQASQYVDRVLVSTDHPEMHAIAQMHGVAAPDMRPTHLAADDAKTVDVVLHVMETAPIESGYVLLVQVTSPLRTLTDLDGMCAAFDEYNVDAEAIVTLVRFDAPHPDKIQKIENGRVLSYLGKESMVARQSLPLVYALNGAFYLTHRDVLHERQTFMPKDTTLPYIMPQDRSLNLDGPHDAALLEALIERGLVTLEEY